MNSTPKRSQTLKQKAPSNKIPGPGRPKRSEIDERNRQLLDKALDLFLEKGFERTSINDITVSVGMAKRTVSSRYGDKLSLFKAALKRAIDDWIVPVERLHKAETEDLEETLVRIARILVENSLSPAGLRLLRITNVESSRLPEIGAYSYTQATQPTIAYLEDLFRRRLSEGQQFVDAGRYALYFLTLVVGAPARSTVWGMPLSKAEMSAHTKNSVQIFLHGIPLKLK